MIDTPAITNPLRAGLRMQRTPEPATMVIFGATGDLTHRKLVPALYNLQRERLLPPGFNVIGFARRDWSDDFFRNSLLRGCATALAQRRGGCALAELRREHLLRPGIVRRPGRLHGAGPKAQRARSAARRIGQPAVLPGDPARMLRRRSSSSLAPPGWRNRRAAAGSRDHHREAVRARSAESARALNAEVHQVFDEAQIYRIDHYLGKETVQNILVFRFANGIFEPMWNRRYIDHVQITVAETVGVEGRGGYYEQAGALRDMVQNHLLQLLTLDRDGAAGGLPRRRRARREGQGAALHPRDRARAGGRAYGARPVRPWRGQRPAGAGYREEPGVAPDSRTETFVALRFFIDNWRWAGVPFYLRTGKRLPKRVTEIAIQFRQAPLMLFDSAADDANRAERAGDAHPARRGHRAALRLKVPGQADQIRPVTMDFRYDARSASSRPRPTSGCCWTPCWATATLFTRSDEVEAAWSLITPIHQGWEIGARARVPELRGRQLGAEGGRQAAGARLARVAAPVRADDRRDEGRKTKDERRNDQGRRTKDQRNTSSRIIDRRGAVIAPAMICDDNRCRVHDCAD